MDDPLSEAYRLEVLHSDSFASSSSSTITARHQSRKKWVECAEHTEATQLLEDFVPRSNGTEQAPPHSSVPVTEIFARNAPRLFLPALDKHLERYSHPFPSSCPRENDRQLKNNGVATMFSPMDRLARSGKSISDLEHNNVVQPGWKNRKSILGALVNIAIAITGSSAVAKFYSLHGLIDTVQIFALLLNSMSRPTDGSLQTQWKQLIFGTIPNILALNFNASLAYLLAFMIIAALLLWYFWHATQRCKPEDANEGIQLSVSYKSSWRLIFVCFLLSVVYLPMSTIAVHALVWSNDFWVTRFDTDDDDVGPTNEFRDPDDLCYTTTMKRNELNLAPVIVAASTITFICFTIWFPIRLRKIIRQALPSVDKYTELGSLRSKSEMDREYQRLLDRDKQPLAFLYKDFRRGWGTYKSFYLFAKLSALLVISVFNPENCIFRSLPKLPMSIAREAILVAAMSIFFLLQCFIVPFVHPVDNASEWVSRLNYLLTSVIGLAVAAQVRSSDVLQGPILMIVYISTYGLSAYFTVINLSWTHKLIKRLTGRVDFSIDVFSPRLDISSKSGHVVRRIWQEALSTIFLTSPECRIPSEQTMQYVSSRDGSYPPYLLDFMGSPSERYVENLKILREVGGLQYNEAISIQTRAQEYPLLLDRIQRFHVGPDSYWRDPSDPDTLSSKTYFGNSWWLPFPPTLVIRFDDGRLATLSTVAQFSEYVAQNRSHEVKRRREVRLALRSLNGHNVRWLYEHRAPSRNLIANLCCICFGRKPQIYRVTRFSMCKFKLKQRGDLVYENVQLSSGFDVELIYSRGVSLNGDAIGLAQDFNLSPALARFLSQNEAIVRQQLPRLEAIVQSYRNNLWLECRAKAEVLSYRFLISVYNKPQPYAQVLGTVGKEETDSRVQRLFTENEEALSITFKRFSAVMKNSITVWWYIFWDDLWRRNSSTIKGLQLHESDFNPHYPTSIAYIPLPRPVLERFLAQRGLLSTKASFWDPFNSGFLNKIYLRLNEIAFHNSSKNLGFHVGEGKTEVDMDEIDRIIHERTSTLGTGGGTDHDDSSIRARPNYRWEGLFEDTPNINRTRLNNWIRQLGVWFGITPHWRKGTASHGLALDVVLDGGQYRKLHDEELDVYL